MTIDLTKIEKPFGLLDAETQEALTAHGGPYEFLSSVSNCWVGKISPSWEWGATYRVKPQPPKPREWRVVGCILFDDPEIAADFAEQSGRPIIRVREVVEGEA